MPAVLLVEDEAEVRELIEEAFDARGVKLMSAASDKAAYTVLEESASAFELLIADINLGVGTTGFDVARRARQLNPNLAVIYITGHAAHLNRFGVPGGQMYPKPFVASELVDEAIRVLPGCAFQ